MLEGAKDGRGEKIIKAVGVTFAVYFVIKYLLPYVIPFLIAYVLVHLLNPAVNAIRKKLHWKKRNYRIRTFNSDPDFIYVRLLSDLLPTCGADQKNRVKF